MSWLDFFSSRDSSCRVSFGRGINADISPHEEELFYNSSEAFEQKKPLDGYEYFFRSLINFSKEQSNENITFSRDEETLHFTIFQGTAKVTGTITNEALYAEVIIVKSRSASVALKRYILERNYQFTYSNYFSDGEFIKLKLHQDNIILSPQKIFFPLRELALNADFDKEHIKSEFKDVTIEDISHIQQVSRADFTQEKELEIKYDYLMKWIEELEEKVLTLPSNDNSGMQSFLYLNILFKIDYLLSPKFAFYQKLSKKVSEYFSDENGTIDAKNEEMKRYLLTLKEMKFDAFQENFYTAKYTFNPIEKSSYDDVVVFITESQKKIKWYKNNRYIQIIPTIYNYIAFYSLYNYGMNPLLHELFHILAKVQNSEFFAEMGCESLYDTKSQSFMKKSIINRIKKLAEANAQQYKNLALLPEELNFSSMNEFCASYYAMLKNLDFEEV